MPYARVLKLPQYFRNLQRLSEIVRVLVRHGFGDLVDRIRLSSYLGSGLDLFSIQSASFEGTGFEARVRISLEELGPTFIKFGQIVSTRPDLFPLPLVNELRRLHDRVAPFPFPEVLKIIELELKKPQTAVFASLEQTPLAAASIAQVHQAVLLDGRKVIVKVQRPNLDRILTTDIEIMTGIATLVEENMPEWKSFSPVKLVEEFARSLKMECDFSREANNAEQFRALFREETDLLIPEIYPEYSTKRILTERFISGTKVDLIAQDPQIKQHGEKVALLLNRVVLKSLFEHGFFHADTHPGNILVTAEGQVALIDFGAMGRLDSSRASQILQFLVHLVSRDLDRMLNVLNEAKLTPLYLDEISLKSQLSEILDFYLGQDLKTLNFSALMSDIFDLMRRYGVRPPPDLLLVGRCLTTLQSIGAEIAPNLVPLQLVKPYLMQRYIDQATDPKLYLQLITDTGEAYRRLVTEFPREFRVILHSLARGELTLGWRQRDLPELMRHQNKLLNRFIFALVGITLICLGVSVLDSSINGLHASVAYFLMGWGALLLFMTWRWIRKSDGTY